MRNENLDPATPRQHRADEGELLEAYLDGELAELDRRRFEKRLAEDADLVAELELENAIRGGLRALEVPCPQPVLERAVGAVESADAPSGAGLWRRLLARLGASAPSFTPSALRPALAAAALALVAALVLSSMPSPDLRPATPAGAQSGAAQASASSEALSAAEVERARREVELAFAYLGKLGRTAESSVKELAMATPGDAS